MQPQHFPRWRSVGRRAKWALFVLGLLVLASPKPASGQVSRPDSAAILLGAAGGFESDGDWDVAEALYRLIVERYGDTPAGAEARRILALDPGDRATRSGRVELQVWTTLYGLWLGVALPGAFGAEDPEPFGVGLLLGGPAGFLAGNRLARSRALSAGQARAITLGGTWGTWQGFGWAEVFDWGQEGLVCDGDVCFESDDSAEEKFASMIVGGLTGIAVGALLSRRPISSGVATTVNFGALWGTWFGVAASVLMDLDGDELLTGTLLGGNAGLLSTAFLAPGWNISRNRARLISIAGVIGGLGGAGIDLVAQPDDEKVAVGIPFVTSIVGLAIGWHTTRDYDARNRGSTGPPDDALLSVRDGRLAVGAPLLVPTALRVDGGGGSSWKPAVAITLFRAEF